VGGLVGLVVLAAILTFCVVQDAETSAGVGRYLTAQRAALAGQGPRVTIDEIMGPANRLAVREGMAWSGRVAMAGLIGILIYRKVRLKSAYARSASARSRPSLGEGGADTTTRGRRG
jgi:hypothetical protein